MGEEEARTEVAYRVNEAREQMRVELAKALDRDPEGPIWTWLALINSVRAQAADERRRRELLAIAPGDEWTARSGDAIRARYSSEAPLLDAERVRRDVAMMLEEIEKLTAELDNSQNWPGSEVP